MKPRYKMMDYEYEMAQMRREFEATIKCWFCGGEARVPESDTDRCLNCGALLYSRYEASD